MRESNPTRGRTSGSTASISKRDSSTAVTSDAPLTAWFKPRHLKPPAPKGKNGSSCLRLAGASGESAANRSGRNASGSFHTFGCRWVMYWLTKTMAPALIACPPSVVSCVVSRGVMYDGERSRSASLTTWFR